MRLQQSWVRFLACGIVTAQAASCGGSSPTEPDRRDAISVVSAVPVAGSSVQLGEAVRITVRLRYSFERAAGGRISLLVFPSSIGLPIFAEPFQLAVVGMEGETDYAFTLRLDRGFGAEISPGPIDAHFSLFPQGETQTSTFAQVRYVIVP